MHCRLVSCPRALLRVVSVCAFGFYSAHVLAEPLASTSGELEGSSSDLSMMSIEELLNITLNTASRKEERLVDAPATSIVVTAQQIQDRGYESFMDFIRDLPGFDTVRGTYSEIYSQRGNYGDENKRTLVMIDGVVEANILEAALTMGEQYSLHFIDRVEVVYGPASALYGANAFDGIINIITKKGKDIDGVTLEAGGGSYNTKFYKFLAGIESGELDITLSGHLFDSDGPVYTERHPEYSASYTDNAYSILARARYQENYELGYSRFDRPAGMGTFSDRPSFYELDGYGWENSEGLGSGTLQTDFNGEHPTVWHIRTETFYLKSNHELADDLNISTTLQARNSSIMPDSYLMHWDDSASALERRVYTHDSSVLGAELKLDYVIDSNMDIVIGFQYDHSDIERGYRASTSLGVNEELGYEDKLLLSTRARLSDIYKNAAAYAQYRLRTDLLSSTNFVVGARYDYNNKYGTSFALGKTFHPRVGIVNQPTEDITLKALFGSAFRAPTSYDMFTETSQRIKNPDLLPEQARSTELSISAKLTDSIMMTASAFLNQFTEIITSNVPTQIEVDGELVERMQNQNQGEVTIMGGEVTANYIFSPSLALFTNMTFQEGEQSAADGTKTDIGNVASLKANLGLTWHFRQWFSLYVVENFVGPRTTMSSSPLDEVDGYAVTNVNLQVHDVFTDGLRLSLAVNNLFDAKRVDPGIRAANGGYYGTTHPQPGIHGRLKVSYSF